MASSGSFNTSNYNGRYVKFEWSISSQSIADNKTTISWTLKGAGEASSGWYMSAPFKVIIEGETVYSSSTRIKLYNGTLVASGTKTIAHGSNGKKTFTASATAAIYSGSVNCSGSGSWDLTDIPRAATITSAPNFNDEENPTISYSNPAGNNVTTLQACIASPSGTVYAGYRDISKTGSSYTFNLTDTEREALRNAATGNTLEVNFVIYTKISGNDFWNSSSKTLSIINAQPTLNPTVIDIGGTSTTLTNNPNTMIKGFNVMSYSIGAAAYKGATIVNQFVMCDTLMEVTPTGVLPYCTTNRFYFYAIDSRGNEVEEWITVPMVNYVPLSCKLEASIEIDGETTSKITYKATGNCWTGSFGAVSNNYGAGYILKVNDEQVAPYTQVDSFKIDQVNHTYEINGTITDLDYKETYTLQIAIYDRINTEFFSNAVQLVTIPVFDWSKEDFNFNVPVTIQGKPVRYEVELFSGYGTNSEMALKDKVNNYDYIEIYYTDNNGRGGGYTKLYRPENITFDLNVIEAANGNTTYIRRTGYTMGEQSITPILTNAGYARCTNGTWETYTANSSYITITRVVGIK